MSLSADITRAREEATAATLVGTNGMGFPFSLSYNSCVGGVDPSTIALGPAPTFALAGICDINRGPADQPLSGTTNRLPWGDHFITGAKDSTYATGSNYSDVDTWGLNATIDWSINDMLELKSITSYRELESVFGVDMDGSPLGFLDTSFTMNQEQFSQEFQLNVSALDGRLRSVLGAYYFQEEGDLLDTVTFAGGLVQIFGPNDLENKAYALFTHNNYQLTDKLGLTFGIRYTEEEKSFTGGQREVSGFTPLFVGNFGFPLQIFPGFAEGDLELLFPPGKNEKDFSDTSVRVGAEYRLGDDILTYASFAQGYKTGGWTTRLAAPMAVSAALAPPGVVDPLNPPEHDSETAETWEVGIKSELFDRRLRLNLALFTTDYEDIQVVAAPAFTFGAPWFFNAGSARIRGAELEMDASLSENFVVNGSFGYLDAEYRSLDDIALAGGITLDHQLMNVPERSANVGGTYTLSLPGDSRLLLHVDVIYKGKMARDLVNTPELIQDGFAMANAAITFEPADANWQLVLGGQNLTDKRYIVTGNDNPAVGATTATYSHPRTWYMTLRLDY
jgi:iron complex outermembrane receptor protein